MVDQSFRGASFGRSAGRIVADLGSVADIRKGLLAAGAVLVSHWGGDVLRRRGTGRLYRRGNVTHRASAPGEPPATDTGVLANSIALEEIPTIRNPTIRVGSSRPEARWLQFGVPGHIEPRPHADVALAESEHEMASAFERAVS